MNQDNKSATKANTAEDKSLRVIKRVVKIMGVLLIIGFAALIVAIIDKTSGNKDSSDATESAPVSQAQSPVRSAQECKSAAGEVVSEVWLRVPGRIEKTIPYRGTLALIGVSDKGEKFIAIADKCMTSIQRIIWFESPPTPASH